MTFARPALYSAQIRHPRGPSRAGGRGRQRAARGTVERNFLIVAADGKVREALAADLRKQSCKVTLATSGAEAERVVRSVSVDAAIVEAHVGDVSAEALRDRLQQIRPECRVVLLTSFKLIRNSPELLRFGDDDYLLRGSQVFDLLGGAGDVSGALGWPWEERGNQSLVRVIDVLVGLIEIEYKLFGNSSHQAMQFARATAEELGAHEDLVHEVVLGTLLRGIGRATVDAEPPKGDNGVSEERNEQLRACVSASLRLLEHIDFPWKVMPVIRHHHERYDGSGVPDGLRGREIPMGARIVAVVDAYVAMSAGDPGRTISASQALAELVRGAGHRFDPEVVEAFHRVIERRLAGRKAMAKPVVLLYEPNEEFRRLLTMRLLNEGLAVEEADGYERTLERMLKEPPALSLVDADHDPSEALQLLQEMHHDEKLVRHPLIFLSRRPDRALKLRALRMGVDEFICKADDLEELVARVENVIAREVLRSERGAKPARRGISGSLDDLSLPDIMQTLTIGLKTACVSITSNGSSGKIWFENGMPKHAKAGKLEGEQAYYEMVRWPGGEFVIEHGARSRKSSIERDAMFLLMEGLRLLDEAGEEQTAAS